MPEPAALPTIDILCRVVDNYGDIGVVYRLAKALSDLEPGLSLRLHVDALGAFRALCPEVDPELAVQRVRGWTVLGWDTDRSELLRERPRLVVECFACGKPEGFEDVLFDPSDPAIRRVVNVEHLSAEDWVPGFHKLVSATRSPLVRKWMFMPGFSPGTGGLIIDRRFREARDRWLGAGPGPARAAARRALATRLGLPLAGGQAERLWLPVFSYERAYGPLVAQLAAFETERPLLALVAAGRSRAGFLAAWEGAGRPFPLLDLPFLPQEDWDEILLASDFPIVRGEESLARAALAGKPFLWHAYLQEGGHQQVKVRALLERLRPLLEPGDFASYAALSLAFNERSVDGPESGGDESLLPVLRRLGALEPGFAAFSRELFALGDLAGHLLTFLREIG